MCQSGLYILAKARMSFAGGFWLLGHLWSNSFTALKLQLRQMGRYAMTIEVEREVIKKVAVEEVKAAHMGLLYAACALQTPNPDSTLRSLEAFAHNSDLFNERSYEDSGLSSEDSMTLVADLMAEWGKPFEHAQVFIRKMRDNDQKPKSE